MYSTSFGKVRLGEFLHNNTSDSTRSRKLKENLFRCHITLSRQIFSSTFVVQILYVGLPGFENIAAQLFPTELISGKLGFSLRVAL
jgi:hypothetical protein